MSLWTRRDNDLAEWYRVPDPIRYKREENLFYSLVCFWIEITTGKLNGEWLITYLTLELDLGYPILFSIFQTNIPRGRDICCGEFENFKQYMIQLGFSDCVPEKKFQQSLLSRGSSVFGEFLDLVIDKLTPKEIARWYLNVSFTKIDLGEYSQGQVSKCVSNLLKRKEYVVLRGETRKIHEALKRHLKGRQNDYQSFYFQKYD